MNKSELIEKYKSLGSKNDECKISILKELDASNELYVEDNIAKGSNLCIILSCPGECELLEQKVCAGQTGKNLERILCNVISCPGKIEAGKSGNGVSKYPNSGFRYSYTIVNASNKVHFRKYNGAEPDDESIRAEDNIKRIKEELSEESIEYFLICGKKAKVLFEKIKDLYIDKYYSEICHIGNVGIRKTYPNSYLESPKPKIGDLPKNERDNKRMSLLADRIKNDWGLRTGGGRPSVLTEKVRIIR